MFFKCQYQIDNLSPRKTHFSILAIFNYFLSLIMLASSKVNFMEIFYPIFFPFPFLFFPIRLFLFFQIWLTFSGVSHFFKKSSLASWRNCLTKRKTKLKILFSKSWVFFFNFDKAEFTHLNSHEKNAKWKIKKIYSHKNTKNFETV